MRRSASNSGLRSRSKMRVVARSYQRSSFAVIVFLLDLDRGEEPRRTPVAEPREELGLFGESTEAATERFDRAADRLTRRERFEEDVRLARERHAIDAVIFAMNGQPRFLPPRFHRTLLAKRLERFVRVVVERDQTQRRNGNDARVRDLL